MNPNDMSKNAAIDRSVLANSTNGAPYVISDEISENFVPGQKRKYKKTHIAPIFDYKSKYFACFIQQKTFFLNRLPFNSRKFDGGRGWLWWSTERWS